MPRKLTSVPGLWLVCWLGCFAAVADSIAELEARLAREPANRDVLVLLAREHHNAATRTTRDASVHTSRALKLLDELLRLDSRHAFGRALLGSTTILTAREVFWPGTKIKRVKDGLALMDAALRDSPDDHNARFTRACNNLYLPDLFERRVVVERDFAWLQERADHGQFDAEFRQYVFLFHGRAHSKWGEQKKAFSLWEAGLTVDPKSKVADELRAELVKARQNTDP